VNLKRNTHIASHSGRYGNKRDFSRIVSGFLPPFFVTYPLVFDNRVKHICKNYFYMPHTTLLNIIGKNIKIARNQKEMKGETLAKELKISKAAISQLENGLKDFRITHLHRIAEILDTCVCNLISTKISQPEKKSESIYVPQKIISIESELIEQLLYKIEVLNNRLQ